MDVTFISIHDLTPEARILYTSESIVDVLGYTPDEIVNRSCWEFFPEEELPYARAFHKRGIRMDKAAALSYCSVRTKQGDWIGCECCFTIVYDVMIVCTSVYRGGLASQKRAEEAPVIRRLFSSSPKDPRYHMLSHISDKFTQISRPTRHEPRAALFLNRFTRTLTIMYATSALEEVIGIPAEQMRGRSFYYCISENCLEDAIKCLENAKGNDSIAYLRFWFRDPRIDDPPSTNNAADDSDEEMTVESSVDQEVGGGVQLDDDSHNMSPATSDNAVHSDENMDVDPLQDPSSRTSSGDSARRSDTHEAIFGDAWTAESSTSSLPLSPTTERGRPHQDNHIRHEPIELEAVISCASDGLVVCLRRARPMIPQSTHRPTRQSYANGLFAAPWATEPVIPALHERPQHAQQSNFTPSLGPYSAPRAQARVSGPDENDFMNSIREQAIFAWALTGINGSLHQYTTGKPVGECLPVDGLPIWESDPMADFTRTDSGSGGAGSTFHKEIGQEPRDSFASSRFGGSDGKGPSSSNGGNSINGDTFSR
ncbi:hypothetical protein MBLNU459_g2475t1 [Dothideomycetes sp. NU459]